MNMVIFASGNGSNAEVLAKWMISHPESVRLCGVLTDNPQAGVIRRMRGMNVEIAVVPKAKRSLHEVQMLEAISAWNPHWILLAGFMRVLTKKFLDRFRDPVSGHYRVINIHPSLLPHFPGLDACRRSYESGAGFGGVTVHLVDEGVDTGPILAQESYLQIAGEGFETFSARGQAVEHRLYINVLEQLVANQGVLT